MWAVMLLSFAVLSALGVGTAYLLLVIFTPQTIPRIASETTYLSARNPTSHLPLPSLFDPPSLALSVIVPAYNERDRLEIMLDEAVEHLSAEMSSAGRYKRSAAEILVVDDGSKDGTAEKALEVAQKWDKRGQTGRLENGSGSGDAATTESSVDIRVVRLERNRGKGGAVRHGTLFSRGERILFADADGASKFSDLAGLQIAMDRIGSSSHRASGTGESNGGQASKSLQMSGRQTENASSHTGQHFPDTNSSPSTSPNPPGAKLSRHLRKLSLSGPSVTEEEQEQELRAKIQGHGVVVGSRAHLVTSEAVVKRSLLRNLLMHGFHLFLRTLGVSGVRDTQCGFKLFTRETARTLFPTMHLHRWSFDVELLLIASLLRIPIAEVPIDWHEVSGSKISIALDGLGMARDLLVLRGNLLLGRWGLPELTRSDGRGGMT